MKISNIQIYLGPFDKFYLLLKNDSKTIRNNKILNLFDIDSKIEYRKIDGSTTNKIHLSEISTPLNIAPYKPYVPISTYADYEQICISRKEFYDAIPDSDPYNNCLDYIKNKELKRQQVEIERLWNINNQKYKCTSAYKYIKNPLEWEKCPNCNLIPRVWEFNNGRSTACGCGKNEYEHHSISAESIMSFVGRHDGSALNYDTFELRDNWNKWVKTGVDTFLEEKKKYGNKIW